MKFLEKNLEQIIYEDLLMGELKTVQRGLNFKFKKSMENCVVARQFKCGGYGIADIVIFHAPEDIQHKDYKRIVKATIFELKKDLVDINTIGQVMRYKNFFKRSAENFNLKNTYISVNCVIVGSEINKDNDFVYIYQNMEKYGGIDIFTYDYGVDGISFQWVGKSWSLTRNEGLLDKNSEDFLTNMRCQLMYKNDVEYQ